MRVVNQALTVGLDFPGGPTDPAHRLPQPTSPISSSSSIPRSGGRPGGAPPSTSAYFIIEDVKLLLSRDRGLYSQRFRVGTKKLQSMRTDQGPSTHQSVRPPDGPLCGVGCPLSLAVTAISQNRVRYRTPARAHACSRHHFHCIDLLLAHASLLTAKALAAAGRRLSSGRLIG